MSSETVGDDRTRAVILGETKWEEKKECTYSARLVLGGSVIRTLHLPDPEKQAFSIIDFSGDGKRLLLDADRVLEEPYNETRNVTVTVLDLAGGQPHWANVWDIFGWGDCDATVEPQGFTPEGRLLLRIRPSVLFRANRAQCVPTAGLYATDLAGHVQHLPDDASVQRYGKLIARSSTPCKTDPDIIAACFSVHGRLSAWNDSPTMRIWRMGTSRILGVDDDSRMPIILQEKMDFGVEAWGDYEVCPLTHEKPGWMQMVCVESADHLFFKDLR
jgi:hypothetical protein